MSPVWEDPRVSAGMAAQLDRRAERLASGERAIGWKVGFGASAAKEQLGIDGPLVGFLTDRAQLRSGETVRIGGWTKPALEPEIAVHMATDLDGGASRERTAAAIAGLGPAIELADLDLPLDDLETIVAGNIFQRHVVLGPCDTARAGGSVDRLVAIVRCDGEEIARTDDPLAMVGADLVEITRHVANLLAASGERLRTREAIITGSVVPIIWPEPGEHVVYELASLGSLELRFEK